MIFDAQCEAMTISKIAKPINKTFTGLKCNVNARGIQNMYVLNEILDQRTYNPPPYLLSCPGQNEQNWLSCLAGGL